ncbi:MAG: hypothetical protein JSW20_14905 [Nitrospiraceae bacterium]|nr:MAG: hypothetical protein JSW20_14905 [Nitrospiraceae bacterium]
MNGTDENKFSGDSGYETFLSQWNRRSAGERLLLDEGPMTIIIVLVVLVLWGVELFANMRSGVQGWSAVFHLVVIGSLEVFIAGYLVRAVVRKAYLRFKLSQIRSRCYQE